MSYRTRNNARRNNNRSQNNRPSSSHSNNSNNYQRNQQQQVQRQKFCTFCKKLGKDPNGHFVKECKELQKIKCKNCGKAGHTIRYCPYIEKCKFCDRVGHTQEKCFYNPSNKIDRCSGCKGFGHTYNQCYHVSKEDKENKLKELEKRKMEEEKKVEKEEKIKEDFRKKGITESISYLKMCKKNFETNPNFIPWVIFCDSDDDDYFFGQGLTEGEQYELEKIKYQVSLL